jgi:CheY-like chemotaxis protein
MAQGCRLRSPAHDRRDLQPQAYSALDRVIIVGIDAVNQATNRLGQAGNRPTLNTSGAEHRSGVHHGNHGSKQLVTRLIPGRREFAMQVVFTKEITILIVDDNATIRRVVSEVLSAEEGLLVVGEAADGLQAVDMVDSLHPTVVIMDIAMPRLNGLDATRKIMTDHPDMRVLILTMHENRQYAREIAKLGVAGCVLKREVGRELVTAVEAVARGQTFFSDTVAELIG